MPLYREADLERFYEEQLSPLQQKALAIAREHLGCSFDMSRSVGFHQFQRVYLAAHRITSFFIRIHYLRKLYN